MEFNRLVKKTLEANASGTEFSWLQNAVSAGKENDGLLQLAFVAVPRYVDKKGIQIDAATKEKFIEEIGFAPEGWSLHRLARVFILLNFKANDEKKYVRTLSTLFETAEVNELATLNSSLPFLHFPENWLPHAKEGVRSNIAPVFDAIAFSNPYPYKHFDEPAWNQLVLKTIFSGKSIQKIYGIKERTNKQLAYMVSDFAHERWAAGRPISPQVWELVTPYVDDRLVGDIETLFLSDDKQNQYAAALTCTHSEFGPAKNLLKKYNVVAKKSPMKWSDL